MRKSTQIYAYRDTFSPKVIMLSLFSLLLSVLIVIGILYVLYDKTSISEIFQSFSNTIDKLFTEFFNNNSAFSFTRKYSIRAYVMRILMYIITIVPLYFVLVFLYGFIISFFIPIFTRDIQKKYYPNINLKSINILYTPIFYIRTIIITILLLLLLIPAYFIPVVNLLIFLPLYYFFHKTLIFDVSGTILTHKEYIKLIDTYSKELKLHTLFCFFITLIPIVGLLLYPFYINYIGHFIIKKVEDMRYAENFQAI